MAEITSVMKNIKGILDNKNQFIIPDFQRSFVWTEKNIDTLFSDFKEDTNNYTEDLNKLHGYLLGNIVLISSESDSTKFEVIDGQQRLTTLTLIFCALNSLFNRIAQEEPRNDGFDSEVWTLQAGTFKEYFRLLEHNLRFKDFKILHTQDLDFKETYKAIIQNRSSISMEDSKSADNIERVYESIEQHLFEISEDSLEKLLYFLDYITTKVKLIETIAPSIDRAFQLFEILNDRGQSLEPLDLLKNHFLKVLTHSTEVTPSQVNDFTENWNNFLKNLKDGSNKSKGIETATFVKHFILGTDGKNIKKKEIFTYFKRESFGATDILQLSNRLKTISKVYTSIENNSLDNEFLIDDNGMYTIFELLGTVQIHPLLMPFYSFSQSDKQRLLNALARYVAAVLFSFTQTNYIEKEIPDILASVLVKSDEEKRLKIAINELEVRTKSYVEIIKAVLPVKDFGSKNKKKAPKAFQILKFIELYLNQKDSIKTDTKIQLEHIMPQSADLVGYSFETEESRRDYLNHLGNLTLLDKRLNNSANNEKFSNKLEHYRACEFVITKALAEAIDNPIHNQQKLVNF
ncbi:DUF262 domain-containing protein [Veillonella caviae]|uniref:DUF262 domain-containing protein n=1 Tax=Veillonella caviae TaxID=248316 RepID=UPI0023F681DF|nr:DUF262 domain-containing HNH endonuclease family protein [Veillonella caviae]